MNMSYTYSQATGFKCGREPCVYATYQDYLCHSNQLPGMVEESMDVDICVVQTAYTVRVTYVNQWVSPINGPIRYPCDSADCFPWYDLVTWIRSICVPVDFPIYATRICNVQLLYSKLIYALSLCNNNFLTPPADIPDCPIDSSYCHAAVTSPPSIFCHAIAFPQCMNHMDTCYTRCYPFEMDSNQCCRHCFVVRRYCMDNGVCGICSYNNATLYRARLCAWIGNGRYTPSCQEHPNQCNVANINQGLDTTHQYYPNWKPCGMELLDTCAQLPVGHPCRQ